MYNSTGLVDDQFNALYECLKAAICNSLKQDRKTGADSDSSRYHRGTRQVPKDTALLIDGTLLPCWRWKAEKTIFSGKLGHSGVNVQSRH